MYSVPILGTVNILLPPERVRRYPGRPEAVFAAPPRHPGRLSIAGKPPSLLEKAARSAGGLTSQCLRPALTLPEAACHAEPHGW
jgi:hypothetical protein